MTCRWLPMLVRCSCLWRPDRSPTISAEVLVREHLGREPRPEEKVTSDLHPDGIVHWRL